MVMAMGPTATPNRADAHTGVSLPAGQRAICVLAGLLAIVLILSGSSAFNGALQGLTVGAVLDDLGRDETVAPSRVDAALQSLAQDDRQGAVALKQRGYLTMLSALSGERDSAAVADDLANARRWLADGLTRQPSDPFGWLWLTQAEVLSRGFTPAAVGAYVNAQRQAQYFGRQTLAQVDYGLLLWPLLTNDTKAVLLERTRAMAMADPRGIARVAARRGPAGIERIRRLLADEPRALRRFERYLENG